MNQRPLAPGSRRQIVRPLRGGSAARFDLRETADCLAARADWEIRMTPEKKILTHEEVLELLSEQAANGSISAAIALERALRQAEQSEKDSGEDELDRILTG